MIVFLLDDNSNELEFFSAIGETGFGLVQMRFPADKGIAGHALQNRQPIVVNDVQTCPYFFKNIDKDSGFTTKSILAVPLISGEECIGVIEAINKVGRDSFDEQDKRILMAIADEVALAIKNTGLILATDLEREPKTHLERILCDADLDHIGRNDSLELDAKLRDGRCTRGVDVSDDEKWYKGTLNLIENHQYYTESQKRHRDRKKKNNIEKILHKLEKLEKQKFDLKTDLKTWN